MQSALERGSNEYAAHTGVTEYPSRPRVDPATQSAGVPYWGCFASCDCIRVVEARRDRPIGRYELRSGGNGYSLTGTAVLLLVRSTDMSPGNRPRTRCGTGLRSICLPLAISLRLTISLHLARWHCRDSGLLPHVRSRKQPAMRYRRTATIRKPIGSLRRSGSYLSRIADRHAQPCSIQAPPRPILWWCSRCPGPVRAGTMASPPSIRPESLRTCPIQKRRDKVTVTGRSSARRSSSVGTMSVRKVPAGAQQNVNPDTCLSAPALAPSKVLV